MPGGARVNLEDEFVQLNRGSRCACPGKTRRDFEAGPDRAESTAYGATETERRDAEATWQRGRRLDPLGAIERVLRNREGEP